MTQAADAGQKPRPICKAILMADTTIIDSATGKVSVIGVIQGFKRLPTGMIAQFSAFVQLIGGIGAYRVSVEVHDLHKDTLVARSPYMEIDFPDRFFRSNVIIPVPPLQLDHDGSYSVVVCIDGVEIDRQQFEVKDMPEG